MQLVTDGHYRAKVVLALGVVVAIGVVALARAHLRTDRMQERLLAALPDAVAADPALVRFAVAEAKPLYARHCAACHGADLHGNAQLGAPDLTDDVWLYGDGSLYDIERTILYGARAGVSSTHDEAEMPAFGLRGVLSDSQVRSVVQYVLQLSGRPYQVEAANDGRALYFGVANCGDCHGPDARGNNDYGAPDLTRNVWSNGGDPQSLYASIYGGRHRIMPAWRGTLSLEQIRALATYVYAVSHPPDGQAGTPGGAT
ncbi:MAG TPA: c-type cytochrome [Steroidobacteraceae bacterium]|nr:c-type cytochrome [Steroidobacteraceae bacterium]